MRKNSAKKLSSVNINCFKTLFLVQIIGLVLNQSSGSSTSTPSSIIDTKIDSNDKYTTGEFRPHFRA